MPDTNYTESTTRVDGFIVVSRLQDGFVYQHHKTLDGARDDFAAIRRGEHRGWSAVGIVPAINGLPYGGTLDSQAMDLVAPGLEVCPATLHSWKRSKFDHPECHSGVIYRQGQQARAMGIHQGDNPYVQCAPEHGEWARGWHGMPSRYVRQIEGV